LPRVCSAPYNHAIEKKGVTMKQGLLALLLIFCLLFPVLAAANPAPDEQDQNISLIFKNRSICVVLLNLVTGVEHRLVRESDAGDEMLLDGQVITEDDLTASGRFVVPDICVPVGMVTYRLYRKSGDGWHEYAGSGVGTLLNETDAACTDEAAICDGAAEEAQPYEGTDNPVCGCSAGGDGAAAGVVLQGMLLIGVWAWLRKGRIAG
jgi:hypothetical protein